MTFPVVQTRNESAVTAAGTSHAVNLPTGITAGDLLIVILAGGGTNALQFNTLTGWTELLDENVTFGVHVWYRLADGSEGATVTFTSTASSRSAAVSYRISGAEDPGTQAPQISTVATGTSNAPNPGSLSPAGGAKDYLWITFFANGSTEEADDDTWLNNAATNYANQLAITSGTGGTNVGAILGSCERTNNAASEDAVWPAASTDTSAAWRAFTLAVHPSSVTTVNGTGGQTYVYAGAATGEVSQSGPALSQVTGPVGGRVFYRWPGYVQASSIPPIPETTGTASQIYAYAGSGTGTVEVLGSGGHIYVYAGTGTGGIEGEGAGSSTYVYAGTGAGQVEVTGSASSSYGYTGAATGQSGTPVVPLRQPAGQRIMPTRGGYVQWTPGTPTVVGVGSGTGSYTYTGTAQGQVTILGSAAGNYAYSGAATGAIAGSGGRTYSYVGSGTGQATVTGSASGSYGYAGSGAGQAMVVGSAGQTYPYNGTGTGSGGAQGGGSQTYGYTGTAAGQVTVVGSAGRTYAYAGAGAGQVTVVGVAVSTYGYAGAASGVAVVTGSGGRTYSYTGAGSGVAGATAAGSYPYSGQGAGQVTVLATAAGFYGYAGATSAGVVEVFGTAAHAYAYAGSGTGGGETIGSASSTYIYGSAVSSAARRRTRPIMPEAGLRGGHETSELRGGHETSQLRPIQPPTPPTG